MKCPYCDAQIAYSGEEHGCPYPELSSGDPPTPEDFGGSDEESHYASQTKVEKLRTKEEFEAVYGEFDPSKSKLFPEHLNGDLARAVSERERRRDQMTPDDPDWCEACFDEDVGLCAVHRAKQSKLDDMIEADRAVAGPTPEQEEALRRDVERRLERGETLDELRARLVARLDATSWARNDFCDERVAKQVIVVRTDLKMRKGKMGTQIGHAVMKVFLDRVSQSLPVVGVGEHVSVALPHPRFADRYDAPTEPGAPLESVRRGHITIPLNAPMMDWLMGRFTKVCCRADSEEELLRVCDAALKARLSCALIQDAGLTEFDGVPTLTCCAIGPAYPSDIDPVTGHLKLL